MTLDEAVRILTLDKACDFEGNAEDLEDALQLGIEALKRLQDWRSGNMLNPDFMLPGETE